MTKKVLVIGAAHLDIIGDYDISMKAVVDKPGTLFYSIGGTAYNIASNLAQNDIPIKFVTRLKESSLIKPIIETRLKSYDIDTSSVMIEDIADESGFLAQRENGQLISAVTSSNMDNFVLGKDIETEISDSQFVIVDCNISSTSIEKLQNMCARQGKKMIVAGVSEAKAKRIMDISRNESTPYPIFIFAINEDEAAVFNLKSRNRISKADIINQCTKLGCENLIITLGEDGYVVMNILGQKHKFSAPVIPNIMSLSGAGDALLSAICSYYYKKKEINWGECDTTVRRFVTQSLTQKGATLGAETAPRELRVIQEKEYQKFKEQQNDKIVSILGSKNINIFGAKIPRSEVVAMIASALLILSVVLPFVLKSLK